MSRVDGRLQGHRRETTGARERFVAELDAARKRLQRFLTAMEEVASRASGAYEQLQEHIRIPNAAADRLDESTTKMNEATAKSVEASQRLHERTRKSNQLSDKLEVTMTKMAEAQNSHAGSAAHSNDASQKLQDHTSASSTVADRPNEILTKMSEAQKKHDESTAKSVEAIQKLRDAEDAAVHAQSDRNEAVLTAQTNRMEELRQRGEDGLAVHNSLMQELCDASSTLQSASRSAYTHQLDMEEALGQARIDASRRLRDRMRGDGTGEAGKGTTRELTNGNLQREGTPHHVLAQAMKAESEKNGRASKHD